MVVLYSWSDFRDIPWSRVRVTSFIIPGGTVMVILYSWSGVRDIPRSRVGVMVLTCSGVIVMVFTGS